MTTFVKCDEKLHKRMYRLMELHHAELKSAGVSVCCIFAHAALDERGEPVGPALKLHGIPASAIAKIVTLKDRVKGMSDVEISIDGDNWARLSEREQDAILDHELQHFRVRTLRGSEIAELDDCGRPVVKMRPHDFQVGWFHAIAERYGEDSVEMQQAAGLVERTGQLYLPLGSP